MSIAIQPQVLELLVTGLPSSGKSTFVNSISSQVRDAQGWFCGELIVDRELHLKFLEPPQLHQFDFIWLRELIEHVNVPGFIVLADSTRPEYFGALVSLLETIHYNHPETPCVLVTNKQDQPEAWRADDIHLGLGLPDFIPVYPCDARKRADVKHVTVQLLYKIFG
jgi:signal recognition particle receptor subunit beta